MKYLKEQSQVDKLIVSVVHAYIFICNNIAMGWTYTIMYAAVEKLGQDEGGMDPAIGVHN